MSILEVKNLNLSFKTSDGCYRALHDVCFSINKGEILALAGESGCGKTMTAMSVLRLLPVNAEITSGEIIYKNKNLLFLKEKEMRGIRGKEIALIPQDPAASLNPLYTIGSQILEVIELHRGLKGSEAQKAAIEALEQVKIPDAKARLKAYPHEFSGGMRQRAAIAIAIACRPEIIIADEPATALDVTVQAQITELLKEIKREMKTSFLFISHDFGLISETADRVCVMYNGRIVENASAEELFKNPKHPYTQALIKALPDFNSLKLEAIAGMPPSIKEVFPGCPFEPRCAQRMEKCRNILPKCTKINDACVMCLKYE